MLRALLIFCFAAPLPAQILVDTFAGGTILSGVPAQTVLLEGIAGIAWDPAGNLVFCDSTNNMIRRVRTDGVIETVAGTGITGFGGDGGPAVSALLNSPSSPAYDVSGNLYFLDTVNNRIRRIDTNGIITTVAGDGIPFVSGMDAQGPAATVSLGITAGLTVDAAGNVYFSEQNENRIRRVTTSGMVEVYAGGGAPCGGCSNGDGGPAAAAFLDLPTSLATDGAGNLFFVDSTGTVIRRVSASGVITTFAAPVPPYAIGSITGIAADPAGNIYAAFSNQLVRYGPGGSSSVIAGGGYGPASPDGPALPSVIVPSYITAVDAHGNIGFVDIQHRSVDSSVVELREVTPQSTLKTLAGANPKSAPDGTPLRNAWFLDPSSIAFDQSGNLYLAESQACLIRKIDAGGNLTTFAGTGVCGSSAPSGNAKTANLAHPISIAVDGQSRVWVVDDAWNLYSVAQDGTVSAFPAVAPGTWQIAIDAKNRLYVLNQITLLRILPDQSTQAIVAGYGSPLLYGIGTDPSGSVYFNSSSGVYRINDDATYTLISGDQSRGAALEVDGAGNIWEAVIGGIEIITASGGTGIGNGPGFAGDGGFAQDASFSISGGAMAFAPGGELYFIDSGRIRRLTGSGPANPPVISPNGIVSAASYTGGGISPGELISIFGVNFGANSLELLTSAAPNNSLPFALGRTKVFFNGYAGAITAATADQINVFVPPSVLNTASPVTVVVEVDDVVSAPVSVPLAATAPGLFTADSSGSGQGAILNQDGSINSSAHPAARGSIVSLFGTGEGLDAPQLPAGALVISTPYPAPINSVAVSIGGQPAEVRYAGAAPLLPTGVFQINALIPESVSIGNVPVSVSVGLVGATRQVTISVQ